MELSGIDKMELAGSIHETFIAEHNRWMIEGSFCNVFQ